MYKRKFIPTVVPAHTAIIRFCNGKARDTAVRAFSLSRETKTLSTMLYSAWTSMEIIMGMAIPASSRPTGWVPILFSVTRMSGSWDIVSHRCV